MLEQLEAVVDAVVAGQNGRGERDPGLEDPRLARLEVDGIDVGRVDEEVGPEVLAGRDTASARGYRRWSSALPVRHVK